VDTSDSGTLRRAGDGKLTGLSQDIDGFVWISEGVDYKGNIIRRKGTVTLIK